MSDNETWLEIGNRRYRLNMAIGHPVWGSPPVMIDEEGLINDQVEEKSDVETLNVDIKLPPALRTRAFKDESSVGLLQVATIIYNNELAIKPEIGIGKLIFFLKNEKMEYDFRVHSISFSPTLDLENVYITARISSNDNKMVDRLVKDRICEFYLSGKLTQLESGDIDTIVITKIIANVDQTAYAKRMNEAKKKQRALAGLPEEFANEEVWNSKAYAGVKMKGVKEAWEEFQKKAKTESKPTISITTLPEEKKISQFDVWRKRYKKMAKKVDSYLDM